MEQKSEYVRESAKRMFAKEFNAIRYDIKFDDDEKAPTFTISPTGALANRVIISGVLTSKEKVTEPQVIYKGVITDNTGNFRITASHFNPQAQQQMALIKETPAFVTVIGKPSLFKRDDGRVFPSIRVENIVVTDKLTRDLWILDTAKSTLGRIELLKSETDPWVKDVKDKYNPDIKLYESLVQDAVNSIVEPS